MIPIIVISISILKTFIPSNKRETIPNLGVKLGIVLILYILLFSIQVVSRDHGYFIYTPEYYQYIYQSITIILLLFYITRNSYEFRNNIDFISSVLVGFIYFNGLAGILQYILNNSIFFPQLTIDYVVGDADNKRATGVLVSSSNGAGNFGALLFGISLFLFIKKPTNLRMGAIVVNLIFLILTFTRIGYLSVFIQSLIFLVLVSYKYFKKLNFLHVSILIFSFMFFVVVAGLFIDDIYNIAFVQRGTTADSRFIQYDVIFNSLIPILGLAERLFGIGTGQYVSFIFSNLNYPDLVIHSQIINTYIENGIFGVILYVSIIVLLYIFSLRGLDKEDKWYAHAAFWGFLIFSNFNPNQAYAPVNYLYFLICLYLIILGGKKNA